MKRRALSHFARAWRCADALIGCEPGPSGRRPLSGFSAGCRLEGLPPAAVGAQSMGELLVKLQHELDKVGQKP